MLPASNRTDPSAFHPQLADVDDVLHVRQRRGDGPLEPGTQAAPEVVEVAQIWCGTVLGVQHLGRGTDSVWIGDGLSGRAAPDFFVDSEGLPSDRWALIQREADGLRLRLPPNADAFLHRGDERWSLQDLVGAGRLRTIDGAWQTPLHTGDTWVFESGSALFLVRTVPGAGLVPPAPVEVDHLFWGALIGVLFIAAAIAITLAMQPYDPNRNTVEVPEHFVKLMLQEQEKKKAPAPKRQEDAGEGKKAKDEPGKTGDKESRLKRAKGPRIAQNNAELNRQIAMKAGLLAEIDRMDDNALFGADGLGAEVTSALGGLIGTTIGRQQGVGGLAGRGWGLGGGGDAAGIGGVALHGDGFGREGHGTLPGIAGPTKPGGSPGVSARDPIILGALDKSVIDEVVKKKLPAIRYCYQRQLNQQPTLAGKLVMKFTIDKHGGVSSATPKSSTLHNAAVDACVQKQFLRMRFPPPRGGGIVIVAYPFVFQSAG
jgi:outer membrane biosynthesis protein TonB